MLSSGEDPRKMVRLRPCSFSWEVWYLMVSGRDFGSSGLGSCPGQGHCVVLLGKDLTLTVHLSTQVYKSEVVKNAGIWASRPIRSELIPVSIA